MMGAMSQQGGGGAQGFGNLMAAGQQLASQMQQQNPELVEQFRRQFQGAPGSENEHPQNPQNGIVNLPLESVYKYVINENYPYIKLKIIILRSSTAAAVDLIDRID